MSDLFNRPTYQGTELKPFTGRPGAMDAYDKPSIVNGKPTERKAPMNITSKVQPFSNRQK